VRRRGVCSRHEAASLAFVVFVAGGGPGLGEFSTCCKRRAQGSQFAPPPSEPSRLRFSVAASNLLPGGLAGIK